MNSPQKTERGKGELNYQKEGMHHSRFAAMIAWQSIAYNDVRFLQLIRLPLTNLEAACSQKAASGFSIF